MCTPSIGREGRAAGRRGLQRVTQGVACQSLRCLDSAPYRSQKTVAFARVANWPALLRDVGKEVR